MADIFTQQQERAVQNDWTIQYKNEKYQLSSRQPCAIQPRKEVTVAEQLNGAIHIIYNKQKLNFKEIMSGKGGHFYCGLTGFFVIFLSYHGKSSIK